MANSPQIVATPGMGRLIAVNVVDPRAREFLIVKQRLSLGSAEANDLVVRDNSVSRRHARLSFAAGRCVVEDLGSTNGTFLNNRRIDKAAPFDKGDRLRFGAAEFVFISARSQPAPAPSLPPSPVPRGGRGRKTKKIGDRARLAALDGAAPKEIALARRTAIIGSAPQSAIALEHASVSDRHAKLTRRFGRYALRDLGSAHGTFVNGQRVSAKRRLVRGDEIRFGSKRFVFLQTPKRRRMRLPWRAPLITLLVLFLGALALTEHYIISARPESRALAARPIPAATAIARAGNSGSTPTPPPPGWLRRLNYWRGLAGVAPAATDPAAAAGAAADARYIVKNYLAKNPRTPHFEDPHNPWFTPAGADAARHAQQDQVFGPGVTASSLDGIDGWIDGPLHRMGLLDPNLTAAQFASYCEPGACAALLVLDRQTPVVTGAVGARAPIMFPADRMQLDATRTTLIKSEWPEPLSLTCAGYVRPVGYAVTLQLGSSFVPKLISYSLARDGSQIEACGYDSLSYSNSDEATQQWAQEGLKDRGAIVIIPRAPLIPGASYEVALTVEAQTDPFGWGKPSPFAGQRRTYNWAFTVAR